MSNHLQEKIRILSYIQKIFSNFVIINNNATYKTFIAAMRSGARAGRRTTVRRRELRQRAVGRARSRPAAARRTGSLPLRFAGSSSLAVHPSTSSVRPSVVRGSLGGPRKESARGKHGRE